MLFEIFADSGCDIPVEMMKELNIHPVYFYVSFDGETYKKEKLEVNTTAYYKKMIDENAFPKTSLPSVQDYVDAFTPVSASLIGVLGVARIDWGTWAKFQIKMQAFFFVMGTIFIAIAVAINFQ